MLPDLMRLAGCLALIALAACAAPEPAPPPPAPQLATEVAASRVELGRRLFYDADLSIDGTLACANCHVQRRGFTDSNRTRPGVHGDPGLRNIQTLANIGEISPLTWADPRQITLEQQVLIPLAGDDPIEMGMDLAILPARLAGQPCYPGMFAAAFPEREGAIDISTISIAVAAFQRSLVSNDTPHDRYLAGDALALDDRQKRGEALFKSTCATCHSGRNYTDTAFHRITGNPSPPASGDLGLARVTLRSEDEHVFRTPGLRNVAVSGPYLHDGSADTLDAAILAHDATASSPDQRADIVAFLAALTDQTFLTNPAYALPKPGCPAGAG
jgi:cytochrome c peroxidase